MIIKMSRMKKIAGLLALGLTLAVCGAAAKSCRGLTRWFFVGFVTAMAGLFISNYKS